MIRVTVHRKFADRLPSPSASPWRGFRATARASAAAIRLLAAETQQPGHERVGEYVVSYRWDTGRLRRDYYRAMDQPPPEYLRSETVDIEAAHEP